ncbi:MAG: hypothetical protein ABSF75_11755 [Terracidiphilus sp.]|jgi:hypothetical protein
MTTVDIVFRYATPPTEQVAFALAHARDVYGIRQLSFDRVARTLRIEYDATRLNAAAVTKLVREAGLDIAPDDNEGEPLIAAPAPAAVLPPTA